MSRRTQPGNDRTQRKNIPLGTRTDGAAWARANARPALPARKCSVCGTPERLRFVAGACKVRREQIAAGEHTWTIGAFREALIAEFGSAPSVGMVRLCVREHHGAGR